MHESATLIHRDPGWNYYEFAGTRFRVRTWETYQERSMRATFERMADDGDLTSKVDRCGIWYLTLALFAVSTLRIVDFVRFSSICMVSTNLNHPKVG